MGEQSVMWRNFRFLCMTNVEKSNFLSISRTRENAGEKNCGAYFCPQDDISLHKCISSLCWIGGTVPVSSLASSGESGLPGVPAPGLPGLLDFPVNGWCYTVTLGCHSEREQGSMRGSFLLLLLNTFSATFGSKPAWKLGLELADPIDIGRPGRPLEHLEDLIDPFPFHGDIERPGRPFHDDHSRGCSDCSNPKDSSSTTGISDQSTDGIGNSLPSSSCPTRWHCKRPSLKNQKKIVCCLRVLRHGRFKCPNSCD